MLRGRMGEAFFRGMGGGMERGAGRVKWAESNKGRKSGGMERRGRLEHCDSVPPPSGPTMVNCKQRFLICHLQRSYRQSKLLLPVVLEYGLAASMM